MSKVHHTGDLSKPSAFQSKVTFAGTTRGCSLNIYTPPCCTLTQADICQYDSLTVLGFYFYFFYCDLDWEVSGCVLVSDDII